MRGGIAAGLLGLAVASCGGGDDRPTGSVSDALPLDAAPPMDARTRPDAAPVDAAPPVDARPRDAALGPPALPTLVRHTVLDAAARGALCNDGSPAAYYVRAGRDAHAQRWVIHLPGGGECRSAEGCRQRAGQNPAFVTSDTRFHPEQRAFDGILDPSPYRNPSFFDWTHVSLVYCSSDRWLGDRPADDETGGYHLRGATILGAVLEDLQAPDRADGLNLRRAEQVLLTGTEAGADGYRQHADAIAAALGGVTVRGVTDGYVPTAALTEQAAADAATDDAEAFGFWNPALDASCAAANELEPWRCLDDEVAQSFVAVPTFVNQDQLDGPDPEPEARRFADAVRAALGARRGAFSARIGQDVWLTNEVFHDAPVDGWEMHKVLRNWLFDIDAPVTVVATP